MLVSWNWLKDYLPLEMPPEEATLRLMMAGLNHESTESKGADLCIDLEITSNRPDCLGHLGIAREIGVLFEKELKLPVAAPKEAGEGIAGLTSVTLNCPELCYRYTARLVQGVKVAPSPRWLAERLATIGVAAINNVVDITNYVLLECGQPLHAFDFHKLVGRRILVRQARPGEQFLAIDHKTYTLEAGMCVIADERTPVALGGVMGGAMTEVSTATRDVLLEAAEFSPLSIRNTARKLNLHSPSSYRFERGLDPVGVEWASRRACELMLELAGGTLAAGVIDVGRQPTERRAVLLRLAQLKRILGIDVPAETVRRILTALGCREVQASTTSVETVPPSWRRDLSREIDLVEEVARIHGYDRIPEDVGVPMAPSHRTDDDRVLAKVRHVLTSAGFDEAVTASVVREELSSAFSPWTQGEAIVSNTPLLRGADRLRRSLVPSLLEARRINESLHNPVIELFETARVYLPSGEALPTEPRVVGLTSGGDFHALKGVVESLLGALNPRAKLAVTGLSRAHVLLDSNKSCELFLSGRLLGFLGEVSSASQKQFGLRSRAAVAELDLAVFAAAASLIPQYQPLSQLPAIARDLNLVVDESVRWADLSETVERAGGEFLEEVRYQETYRDAAKDGPGKKRLLFSLSLRSPERTLTSEETDQLRDRIVAACQATHGAKLLA